LPKFFEDQLAAYAASNIESSSGWAGKQTLAELSPEKSETATDIG
jgi:hypothetical protein